MTIYQHYNLPGLNMPSLRRIFLSPSRFLQPLTPEAIHLRPLPPPSRLQCPWSQGFAESPPTLVLLFFFWLFLGRIPSHENILVPFLIEWNTIVWTIFFLIMEHRTDIHFIIQNWKEDYQHDHVPLISKKTPMGILIGAKSIGKG